MAEQLIICNIHQFLINCLRSLNIIIFPNRRRHTPCPLLSSIPEYHPDALSSKVSFIPFQCQTSHFNFFHFQAAFVFALLLHTV